MEEKKEKKKLNKKLLLICLAIALAFAIIGFMDIKVNAAESNNSISFYLSEYNSKNSTGTLQVVDKYKYVVNGQNDMEVFYFQSHTEETSTEVTYARAYVVSKYPMTIDDYTIGTNESNMGQEYFNGSYSSSEYTINGQTFYVVQVSRTLMNTGNGSWSGYVGLEFDTPFPKTKLSRLYERDEFAQAYANDYLDTIIDYDNLPIDDDLDTISNLLYNIIRNEKPSANDTTGLGIIKDVEYYEYLTWNNTLELPIQVEYVPIVQVYSGMISEKFKKEYYGEWSDLLILDSGTNSYTKRTDSEYLFENDSIGKEFEKEIIDTYVEYLDNTYLFYGYRLRYVDVDNDRCGPWVYAVPRVGGTYYSYVEYSDDTVTKEEDITGTDNTYDNIDDIENAKTDIDKENEVKNEYGVGNDDIGTDEVITWLEQVVDFIGETPSAIGSVLSFLPQPILYGIYTTIFLGIFACAVAIVKALI